MLLQASLGPGPIPCIWPGVGRMDRYPGVPLARRQSRWALVGLNCPGEVQVARQCLSGAHCAQSPGLAVPGPGKESCSSSSGHALRAKLSFLSRLL